MQVNGIEHGRHQLLKIRAPYAAQAVTNAADIEIPLDELPTEVDKCEVRVRGLFVRIPKPTITTSASKQIDAVTLAQLANYVSLRLCGDSPLAAAGFGDYAFQSIPLETLIDVLSWIGGRPVIKALADMDITLPQLQGTPADMNTFAASFETALKRQGNRGWGAYCGPFGEADVGGASWNDDLYLSFPLVQDTEPHDHGIPAWCLTGKRPQGERTAPGALVFNLSTSVDGMTAAFASDGFDVFAECVLGKPGTKMVPLIPFVRAKSFSDSQFRGSRGVLLYSAIRKILSAGAQVATDITTMHQRLGGKIIGDADGNVARWQRYLSGRVAENMASRKGFVVSYSQASAGLSAAKARLFRHEVFNQLHCGSNLQAPGSLDEGIEYDVISSNDSSWRLVEGLMVPTDGSVVGKVLDSVGGGKVMTSTKNGNLVAADAAKTAALPKMIVQGK